MSHYVLVSSHSSVYFLRIRVFDLTFFSKIMTIDDLLDYDIDALVERTKFRPIPRGAISLPRAWIFFIIQVVTGAFLALALLNPTA